MFSDVVAQALSLAALIIAARPSDARRTYGWHRVEILAALGNGLALVALAAVIVWEGWRRLHAPVVVDTTVMMPIAAIGLVANAARRVALARLAQPQRQGRLPARPRRHALVGGGAHRRRRHVLRARHVLARSGAVDRHRPVHRLLVVLRSCATPSTCSSRRCRATSTSPASPAPSAACRAVVAVHDLHIWTITSGLHALSAHIVVRLQRRRRARSR